MIKNEADYKVVISKINQLMAKGSANVCKEELTDIRNLALTAQEYEQEKYFDELSVFTSTHPKPETSLP